MKLGFFLGETQEEKVWHRTDYPSEIYFWCFPRKSRLSGCVWNLSQESRRLIYSQVLGANTGRIGSPAKTDSIISFIKFWSSQPGHQLGGRERSHLVAFSCARRAWGKEQLVEEKRLDQVDTGHFLQEISDNQPTWDPVLISCCWNAA